MSSEISSGNVQNDDYVSRPGQKGGPVPVVRDGAVEEGAAGEGDSDERLARDDKEVIDDSNIVEGRTRGAKPSGGYREPGDEEGLPTDDGTSAVAQ